MKNLGAMLKQAQQMQTKMKEMQAAMEQMTVDGQSGAGMVTLRMNGKGEMTGLQIDPSLMGDDVEILEDLIIAAHHDAKKKIEALTKEKMKELTGGLTLPDGMDMPSF